MIGDITILGVVLVRIIGIAVLCSLICGICVWRKYTKLLTNSNTSGIPYTYFEEIEFDYEKFCNKYTIQSIQIPSSYARHYVPLECIKVKGEGPEKLTFELENIRTVILVHGLGANRYYMYPVAEFFLKKGFQVVTYDQRNTNDNFAKNTTYGYLEKRDLIDCAKYVKKSVTTELLGVWGSSVGGTTAALGVADPESEDVLEFMILDCPVSSMELAIKDGIKRWKLIIPTKYLLWCGSVINCIRMGFSYKKVDVVKVAKDIKIPSLILNSQTDTITPVFMGKSIYDAIPGDKKWIYTVTDSNHAEIYQKYPVSYRNHILDLISSAYEYKVEHTNMLHPLLTVNTNNAAELVERNLDQWVLEMSAGKEIENLVEKTRKKTRKQTRQKGKQKVVFEK